MSIQNKLNSLANKEKAKILSYFFKTKKGEYGEGDVFLGITVPVLRKLAKEYNHLSFDEIENILSSEIHEYRFISLIILINKYQKADINLKKKIVSFYLKNIKHINNWDLVDVSSHKILGDYLLDKDKDILYKLVESKNLWERRISIISMWAFIRKNKFEDALKISKILIYDKHDLIHKAVGWMLREIGKRDKILEKQFLNLHYKKMPRTMLRYSIEKLTKEERNNYLKK